MRKTAPLVVFALAAVACLPFLRYIAWLGDEGVLLHAAQRVARGEKIYRDFFFLLPPLPLWCVAGWQKLFGPTLLSARILGVAIITGTAVATFFACERAGGSRLASAWLALGVVFASQGEWTVLGHRWLAALFCTAAMALIFDGRRSFAAGLLVGAALMTTPPTGALTMLAALIATRRRLLFLAGAVVVPALVTVALALQGLFGEAFRDVVGFTLDGYVSVQALPFGHGIDRQSLLIVAVFPAALLAMIFHRSRAPIVFAIAGALSFLPRADVPHLAFAAPLACPLIALAVPRARPFALVAALILTATTLLGWSKKSSDSRLRAPFAVAVGGTVRFGFGADPDQLEPLLTRIAALPAGESVFFYPYDPMLSYLTLRRHLGPIDVFSPGYTRADQYRQSCAAVADSNWIVIDRFLASAERIKESFPAARDPHPPETAGFEHALESAFDPSGSFGRFELRRRNGSALSCGF